VTQNYYYYYYNQRKWLRWRKIKRLWGHLTVSGSVTVQTSVKFNSKKAEHIVSCQENYDGTVLSLAVAWKLTATGPMWHRQANCSRRAQQRQRRNGRQWWNGALLERQVLLLMRIGDAVVLACLTHDAVHQPSKIALCHRNIGKRAQQAWTQSAEELATSVDRSTAERCDRASM